MLPAVMAVSGSALKAVGSVLVRAGTQVDHHRAYQRPAHGQPQQPGRGRRRTTPPAYLQAAVYWPTAWTGTGSWRKAICCQARGGPPKKLGNAARTSAPGQRPPGPATRCRPGGTRRPSRTQRRPSGSPMPDAALIPKRVPRVARLALAPAIMAGPPQALQPVRSIRFCRMARWVFARGQRACRLRDDSDREGR